MKVRVDVVNPSTTRREGTPDQLTLKVIEENGPGGGNPDCEVAGPRKKVMAWLKRNGYGPGEYEVVEP